MRGSHAPSPAERLLAEIYAAGYHSVDDFIDRLRIRPRNTPAVPSGRSGRFVDPFADTTELHLDRTLWDSDLGAEIDPFADTTEFPAIARIWVIPERHAS